MSGDNTHTTTFVGRETVSETLKKIGTASDETAKKLSGMGKIIGGVALGNILTSALHDVMNFAKQSVGAYETVGSQVLTLKRVVGGSAESASQLRFAMHETGLSVDNAGMSLKQFAKHVEANDKNIKTMGVATRDVHGNVRDFNAVLLDTADRFAHMPAGIEKTALATQLFGRNGLQMLPFLELGKTKLQALEAEATKYGLVLTQDNLNAIQKNIIAHREFQAAMQGVQLQLGVVLLPMLTKITTAFSEWLIQIRPTIASLSEELKPAVAAVGEALKTLFGALKDVVNFLIKHKGDVKDFTEVVLLGAGAFAIYRAATILQTAALGVYKTAVALAKGETLALNAALESTPLGVIVALGSLAALLAYQVGSKKHMAAPGTPAAEAGIARQAAANHLSIAQARQNYEQDYYAHNPGSAGGTSHVGGKYVLPKEAKDPNVITDPNQYHPIDETKTKKAKTSAFDLAKEVAKSYVEGLTGSASQISAAFKAMISVATAAGKAGKTDPTGLVSALKLQQSQLLTLAGDRDLTITRLTNAQSNLKNLQTQAQQLADQISSGIETSFSITSGNKPQTLNEMLGGMTRNADRARQLVSALGQLKAQGLDPALLKDIASAGTERGLDVAQQILVGGASGVQSLNSLQSAIAAYAKDAGIVVAASTYQSGIDAAQGLVDGLKSQEAMLESAMRDLASRLESVFDRAIAALATKKQTLADGLAGQLGGLQNNYSGDAALLTPDSAKNFAASAGGVKDIYGALAFATQGGALAADAKRQADALAAQIAALTGGSTTINNITVSGSLNGDQAAQQIQTMLLGLARTNGVPHGALLSM
jgi:hypothetical protein